jgi:hypothetical protein
VIEEAAELRDGAADIVARVAPAQKLGAEAAQRLAALVDRDERGLPQALVFVILVRTLAD